MHLLCSKTNTMGFIRCKVSSSFLLLYVITVVFLVFRCAAGANQGSTLTVDASNASAIRRMPDTLFGIFYEEINHAGGGGLWAELVSNRGFEAGGQQVPSNIEPWFIVGRDQLNVVLQTERSSCFERNKVALRIDVLCDKNCPPDGVGVANPGFWGMNIQQGKKYKVVFFVRSAAPTTITVSFTGPNGQGVLATTNLIASGASNWKKLETVLDAKASNPNAILQLTTKQKGTIWLDQVSAMPVDTFNGHGFRTELVQMLIDLKPTFLRFPGGCFIEGQTLRNAFRWKDSVGPWEQRPGHYGDVWNYWTDEGFGYFEGLLLAEDIKARPIWVFNNGLSHTDEIDTRIVSPFVQEALDGIEFARGAATSRWGSHRASMGHPAPFDLKYVAIGNEDCGKKNYIGNYLVFHNAIKHAYPDIQIITNCDGSAKPLDHPADLYDFHTYPTNSHEMFTKGQIFDKAPRNTAKAFISEYALTGIEAGTGTLIGGLSEAGFLIGVERNSDLIHMACYAPLFGNAANMAWKPDSIIFNSNQSYGTPSYWVQHMFRESSGATLLKSKLVATDPASLVASAILWQNPLDKKEYLKIKAVNIGNKPVSLKISINGLNANALLLHSTKTVLTSEDLKHENSFKEPLKIVPRRSPLENPSNKMDVVLPPYSLTAFDFPK